MALTVRKLCWLGLSVEDPAVAATFFRDILGMAVRFDEPDSIELETAEGDRVQLFGPSSRYFERARRPFPLFEVDDAPQAHAALSAVDVEIGPLESDSKWTWFDITGPEGLVCELGSRL